ncbi:MAG: DNA-binding protein [Solobacterium sp.]|nr:DNA-binding protein [Solobacterium sp.]
MDYRRFGNTIMIRMDPGEEILSTLTGICRKEKVRLGHLSALGAADYLELGVYDVSEHVYHKEQYTGAYEITSLFGTVSEKDDDVYLHLHLTASTLHGETVGGHLSAARISGTCEMALTVLDGSADRRKNELTGLNDLNF